MLERCLVAELAQVLGDELAFGVFDLLLVRPSARSGADGRELAEMARSRGSAVPLLGQIGYEALV